MLSDAVAAARNQSLPREQYEIIVVDNGSTDGTKEFVDRVNQDGGQKVRYVCECRRGLHWARHAGARASHSELLAYTDDDGLPEPNWVASLVKAFTETKCAACGGPIALHWLSKAPWWALRLYGFAHLNYGNERLELKWPDSIYGPNFAVRKSVLYRVGGFNPDTSFLDDLVGDGEIGLCRKIYEAGGKIVYEPKAQVYHQQMGGDLSLSNMRHRWAQQARFRIYADYKVHRWTGLELAYLAMTMTCQAVHHRLEAFKHSSARNLAYYKHQREEASLIAASKYCLRLAVSWSFRKTVLCEDWISKVDRIRI